MLLNCISEVDSSDEDTEDDVLDLVDRSGSEVEDYGNLDDLGGKIMVDDEGRRTHRVICSNGTVISNYECGSWEKAEVLLQYFCAVL